MPSTTEESIRLLGNESPKQSRDIEIGDTNPLLLKVGASVEKSQGRCRDAVAKALLGGRNPQFASDAELALRASFFVVVLGLPFLIPRDEWPTLDFVMKNGMYTVSVVTFFIYNLYKTTGETIMNVTCGFRGTLLAVSNMWMMYFFFPDGVTETSHGCVFWIGLANGIVFITMMLSLNFQISTVIFAVSNATGFWMAFLQPGPTSFACPFTQDFQALGNVGVNSLITVAAGGFLCIMVTFLPYPRWALYNARDTAEELIHCMPALWKSLSQHFFEPAPNSYSADKILRRMRRLAKMVTTLEGAIANSWYECFGSSRRHQIRRVLNALDKMIHENYDRIYSTCNAITGATEWSPLHAEMMRLLKPSLMKAITEAEVLLQVCFRSSLDGQLSEVECVAIQKMSASLRQAEGELTEAFREARDQVVKATDEAKKNQECMEALLLEHMFALNFAGFVRLVLGFADDLVQQRRDPEHFPRVTERPTISSLWDRTVVMDPMHLNWVARACLSIFTGFAIGYFGFMDLFNSFDASIATTASVLLSKFIGSAMVKNLGRVQGVVLGTVVGQIAHATLGSCEAWSIGALALVLFFYSCITLFTYYSSTDYAYLACLLAAFGGSGMLSGGCGTHSLDKGASYDAILSTVCAISLIVVYDILLPSGRASDMAHKALKGSMETLQRALGMHFDPAEEKVHFHKGDLLSSISSAEGMGAEAYNEPRYWRTEWKHSVYTQSVEHAYRLRYNLATMETCVSEGFKDQGVKHDVMKMLLQTKGFIRLADLVRDKLRAVRPLVGIFKHETCERFPGLADAETLRMVRREVEEVEHAVIAEVAGNPALRRKGIEGSLEKDPLCQVCMVLSSVTSILDGVRELQHCILRSE
mmetsp:Transcript_91612/g.231111  ORF Transcript_91612/g.231111 Transcript_91612/m.231111 type:complete len:872 (+) Transcript_91612:72-2687(+)